MAPILEVDRVVKHFGGVTAVNGVSLSLEPARIYGLIEQLSSLCLTTQVNVAVAYVLLVLVLLVRRTGILKGCAS